MDFLKRFIPEGSDDPISQNSQFPIEPSDRFVKIKGWLASLTPADRTRFTNEYLVPVLGSEAAEWLRQQLVADRAELQVRLDVELAKMRTSYVSDVQPIILKHIKETLRKVEAEDHATEFQNPVLDTLWKVAVTRTGLDIIASGQTTYDDMLRDFDKLIEVVLRMSRAFPTTKA